MLDPSLVSIVRKSLQSIRMLETLHVIWLCAGKQGTVFPIPIVTIDPNNLAR